MRPTLSRPRAWAVALTATFTMAVSYVDRQTLAVLAPTVQEKLHISDNAYGWLVSAFSIAYLVGAPLSGWLIDRVGARRGLLGAVLVWSAVAALHALAPGFGVLFALRIALGLAESPSFPGAAQTIHRALPPSDRGRGFGVLFTGSSFGAMVAPPLATYLEHRFNYQVAFLGTAMVGLSWVPLWLLMANSGPARQVLDHVEKEKREEGALAGRRAQVGGFQLMLQPAVLRGVLLVIASAPLLSFFFNWGAKYLVHDFGLKQHQVGAYLWFPPLIFDAGAILFGHLTSRSARARGGTGVSRGLVAAGMALMLVGAAVPFMGEPMAAMLVASLSMAGGGGIYSMTTTDIMGRVPPEVVSTAGGICAAAQSLTYIVANPLIGLSVTATRGYTQIILLLTGWVLPGCLVWLGWKLASPRVEEAAASAGG
jgi:MFS transporter, ACS family, hexuronate transporter